MRLISFLPKPGRKSSYSKRSQLPLTVLVVLSHLNPFGYLEIEVHGQHELDGFHNYKAYQTIRNLGDFAILRELSKLELLFNNYKEKCHFRISWFTGQNLRRVPASRKKIKFQNNVAASDWTAELKGRRVFDFSANRERGKPLWRDSVKWVYLKMFYFNLYIKAVYGI